MRRYRKDAMSLIENVYKTRKNDKLFTIQEHDILNFFFLYSEKLRHLLYYYIVHYEIKI